MVATGQHSPRFRIGQVKQIEVALPCSKDLFLSLGICVVVEVLDNPGISVHWAGWRAAVEHTRRLITDLAAFATRELNTCFLAISERIRSPQKRS